MKKSKGLALIIVLWVLTLLTIMASSFTLTIRRESAIISGIKEKAQASALAEAGLHYAIVMLLRNDAVDAWQANNSLYEIDYGEDKIRLQISDESGKININFANKEQIVQLLNSIHIEESVVSHLSDALLDWRDKNDLHRLNGAEKEHYKDEGLNYAPRNDLFQSVEELQMVLGMTTDIYQQLDHLISVYGKNKTVNPTTASREVLLTLPDVTEEMVDEYLQQRVTQAQNGETIIAPAWYSGNNKKSNLYMIVAEAKINNSVTEKIMAVIRKTRSKKGLPFEILKWTENYQQSSLFSPEYDGQLINQDAETR